MVVRLVFDDSDLISRGYIGADLTKEKMKQFFRTDEYFVNGTEGFVKVAAVKA